MAYPFEVVKSRVGKVESGIAWPWILNLLNYSSARTGSWGFYVARRQLNTSLAVTLRNLQSFGFSIEFNIYIFHGKLKKRAMW
jgi:hypothetical protein